MYEPSGFATTKNKMNEIAEAAHNKPWDDLKPGQQKRLRAQNKEIGQLETEARKKAYPISKLDLREQEKVRKRIHDALEPAVIASLDEFTIRTGIQRKILNDFWLNDERYATYERLAVQEINRSIRPRLGSKSWSRIPPANQEKLLQKAVNDARTRARAMLLQRINRDEL